MRIQKQTINDSTKYWHHWNGALGTRYPHAEVWQLPHTTLKIQLKCRKDFYEGNCNRNKFLVRNVGVNLCDCGLSNDFLSMKPTKGKKLEIEKLDFTRLKPLAFQRMQWRKWKDNPQNGRKCLLNMFLTDEFI